MILFLTYLIQVFIQLAHFARRRRILKNIGIHAINWRAYNFWEKFLLRYMWWFPFCLFIPVFLFINQVVIESLLVMDYMLGFSDWFRKRKGTYNEKAYFIDNVYDSRESIKVFIESILNIAIQSVFFYLGGSVNKSFSLQNITANEGLGISAIKYFVLSMCLNFVTIIKKVLVI